MKTYKIRYSIAEEKVTEIKADSPQEALDYFKINKRHFPSEQCLTTFCDGVCFDHLTELDENGDDIEGSEFYG